MMASARGITADSQARQAFRAAVRTPAVLRWLQHAGDEFGVFPPVVDP